MTPERWHQVKAIFDEAVELDPSARTEFLNQRCGSDDELCSEVQDLLTADREPGSLLEHSLIESTPAARQDSFGPYVPLRVLGEGGMGTVYLARQQQPIRRDVALKVIKGGMDTRQVIERFESERQVLALMEHPHIARVLDAGTSALGCPYFVMEYVDGVPITRYCDQNSLDTRARLQLFIAVCQALQHAHQKGIIHRDVKPTNILVAEVDGKALPKVIDFGIARATGQRAMERETFTFVGQIIGTPEYMSPEQAAAHGDVDTASDVYSLGVVLYELLVGALPLDFRAMREHGLGDVLRAIQETPVPKPTAKVTQMGAAAGEKARLRGTNPSQLKRELSGDLDWIVMKAIDKDRSRRFASAAEFAGDIERHLRNEPVLAGPPDAAYRLGKFVARYKGAVAGAAAVACALIGGLFLTAWQARVANQRRVEAVNERAEAVREGKEAETQRARAEQQAREAALQRDRAQTARERAITAESQAQHQKTAALAEKQRADYEAATARAVNDFLQNDVLAQASADSQARPGTKPDPDLKVRTALDRAAASIAGKFDTQPLVEASIRLTMGRTYTQLGQYPEAQREFEKALALRRRVLGEEHPDTLEAMDELGVLYQSEGKYGEAEPLHVKVLEVRRRVLGEEDRSTMTAMNGLGSLYFRQGKNQLAEPLFVRVRELRSRILGEEHPETLNTMHNLGTVYMAQAKYAEAEAILTRALELYRRVLGEEHPITLTHLTTMGSLYQRQGKFAQAEASFAAVIDVSRRVLGKEHPATLNVMNNLGVLYYREAKYAQAEPIFAELVEIRRRLLGEDNPDTLLVVNNLGSVYFRDGNYEQAEPILTSVLARLRRVLGPEHPTTLASMNTLGTLCWRQHRYAEAEPLFVTVMESRRRTLGPQHPDTLSTMASLGEMWDEQSRYAEAEPLLREALAAYQKAPEGRDRYAIESELGWNLAAQRKFAEAETRLLAGYQGLKQDDPGAAQAGTRIVQLYQDWGKPQQAEEWQTKLRSLKQTGQR